MIVSNIPYLYSRNGIYYYRHQSIWKSLKTKCKLQAFKLLCKHMSASDDKSPSLVTAAVASTPINTESTLYVAKATHELVNAYLKENSPRWCKREVTRITSCLKFLPEILPTRENAIKLKQSILETKTPTTFNRYLKYFNSFYKWVIANDHLIVNNPFTGLKILEKKVSVASKRNAYNSEQLKTLIKVADR